MNLQQSSDQTMRSIEIFNVLIKLDKIYLIVKSVKIYIAHLFSKMATLFAGIILTVRI